jgi:hypothetical protein
MWTYLESSSSSSSFSLVADESITDYSMLSLAFSMISISCCSSTYGSFISFSTLISISSFTFTSSFTSSSSSSSSLLCSFLVSIF